ncbi:hypothetical protein JI741_31215 [Chryseolinea sp. Jin1]|uniref:Uncharacterized protein n=1 Tax=Chryseolinea lacunae TaxID=2801331 RepID=A0ABS1L2D5_9BACT|nr:hypothetical protein [Chryseolinea lacunae]
MHKTLLSASAAGLDTCPVGLGKFIERTSLYSLLGVADTDRVVIGVTLGYIATWSPSRQNGKGKMCFMFGPV